MEFIILLSFILHVHFGVKVNARRIINYRIKAIFFIRTTELGRKILML